MLTGSPLFSTESSDGKKRTDDPVGFARVACKIRAYKEKPRSIFDLIKKLPAFHYAKKPSILLNNTGNFDLQAILLQVFVDAFERGVNFRYSTRKSVYVFVHTKLISVLMNKLWMDNEAKVIDLHRRRSQPTPSSVQVGPFPLRHPDKGT